LPQEVLSPEDGHCFFTAKMCRSAIVEKIWIELELGQQKKPKPSWASA